MSEHDDPAPAEADTAIADSPQDAPGGEPTEEINWQKRAEDAQAWATRAAQEASELRQWQERIKTDDDAFAELAAERGWDIVADDTPDLDDDPVSALEQRLAAIEAKEQQAAEQAAADAEVEKALSYFGQAFAEIDPEGKELDDEDRDWIITRALTSPPLESGDPDIKGAHAALVARDNARRERWAAEIAPKPRRPSHQFTPGGVPGEDKPDNTTHESRVAGMLNKLSDTA